MDNQSQFQQNINPRTAETVTHNTYQPYARRTFWNLIWFIVALIFVGGFAFWLIFGNADEPDQAYVSSLDGNAQLIERKPTEERSSVYSFFRNVFAGVEDGLDDSDLMEKRPGLPTVEEFADYQVTSPNGVINSTSAQQENSQNSSVSLDETLNFTMQDVMGSEVTGAQGQYIGRLEDILVHKETGEAKALIIDEQDTYTNRDLKAIQFSKVRVQENDGDTYITQTRETIENKNNISYAQFDKTNFISLKALEAGQVFDYLGEVAGQIETVIYMNAEARRLYFKLRPNLVPPDKTSIFSLAFNNLNVVENNDGLDVQLSKSQTEGLAKFLYN